MNFCSLEVRLSPCVCGTRAQVQALSVLVHMHFLSCQAAVPSCGAKLQCQAARCFLLPPSPRPPLAFHLHASLVYRLARLCVTYLR